MSLIVELGATVDS